MVNDLVPLFWAKEEIIRSQLSPSAKNRLKRRSVKKKRITELKKKAARSGFLFCLDTVVIHWNGAKRYVFTAVDRYSRLDFRFQIEASGRSRKFHFLDFRFQIEASGPPKIISAQIKKSKTIKNKRIIKMRFLTIQYIMIL